jgi:hypothetical protein
VLELTDIGKLRLGFATHRWWNTRPMIVVQPRHAADLKKFNVGARVKIIGELTHYYDAATTGDVDAIFIVGARVEAEGDGNIATGSIRK